MLRDIFSVEIDNLDFCQYIFLLSYYIVDLFNRYYSFGFDLIADNVNVEIAGTS